MTTRYKQYKHHQDAANKRWREKNKSKVANVHTDHQRRRRAQKRGVYAEKGITLKALILRDEGICGICKETVYDNPTMDHIIPLIKGGTHTWDNVQLAHFYCNASKGAR